MRQENRNTKTYLEYRHPPMGVIRVIYEDILWIDIEMNKVMVVHMCARCWNHLR